MPAWERPGRMLLLMLLGSVGIACIGAATPDSLTIKDKVSINKRAIEKVDLYVNVLNAITRLDPGVPEDMDQLMEDVRPQTDRANDDRIFSGPNVIIEDNIVPSNKAGSVGMDREVAVYISDFFVNFRSDGSPEPVIMRLLDQGEPKRSPDGRVITQMLYEVTWKGTNRNDPVPYAASKRVVLFEARYKEGRGWSAYIGAENFYDEAQGFVSLQLDRQVKDAKASGSQLSGELLEYEEAAKRAAAEAERERAERKRSFDQAIANGDEQLKKGEFDTARDLYNAAKTIDPASFVTVIIKMREVEKARLAFEQKQRKDFDTEVKKAEQLYGIKEYQRSLESFQAADRIIPGDPNVAWRMDSLNARIRAKADRESAYNTGNWSASLAGTKDLLKKRPDDPELLTLLARTLVAMNRNAEALSDLDKAIAKDPDLAEALRLRASIREKGDDASMRLAEEDYDKLCRRDPWNRSYVHAIAGMKCARQKKCKEAEGILLKASDQGDADVETCYMLGWVNGYGDGRLNDYPRSIGYLYQATAIDPTCAKCFLERGISQLSMDSVDAARVSLQEAQRLKLSVEQGRRASNMAVDWFKRAESEAHEKGNPVLAVRYYAGATVLSPDSLRWLARRALNLMEIPRWEEALGIWDEYITRVDGDYWGRINRARCLLNMERYAEVDAEYDKVERNDLKGVYTKENNLVGGEACFRKGDLTCAEARLMKALRKDGNDYRVLSMLSECVYARKDYDQAEKYAKDAVSNFEKQAKATGADQGDPRVWYRLGLIQQANGKFKESLQSFDKAKYWGQDRDEIFKGKGRSYQLLGDLPQAVDQYSELLRANEDPQSRILRAECYVKLGQYIEAERDLLAVQEKHPEVAARPEFLAQLAFAHVLTGAKREAGEAITSGKLADPDYVMLLLADVAYKWKFDRHEEAVTQLSDLVRKGAADEKKLKELPVLKDLVSSPMWKNRGK